MNGKSVFILYSLENSLIDFTDIWQINHWALREFNGYTCPILLRGRGHDQGETREKVAPQDFSMDNL